MVGAVFSSPVKQGTLTIVWPGGLVKAYGAGAPRATMRIHDWWTAIRIAVKPELSFGEAYMDGRLSVENGTIADILEILLLNMGAKPLPKVMRLERIFRRANRLLAQLNGLRRARRNVAHHYDLSAALYDLFLDADRQYSCAYFAEPDMTLEEAQAAKKRHIAAKLMFDRPELSVLDIGSGWGGMALELAREHNAKVLGITLSTEQLEIANRRAAASNLSARCRFSLTDYRAVEGNYDRIVSVGMFEHVGVKYFAKYFAKMSELLAPDGVALLHTIGRADGPGATNPWIAKYIFPGGYTPALSEITAAVERSGLYVTDVEVLRLHYAETLKAWRIRFLRNRDKAEALYDARFCRMWEFYLAGAEMAFRHDRLVVFQVQLSKDVKTLPVVRDYIAGGERATSDHTRRRNRRSNEAA